MKWTQKRAIVRKLKREKAKGEVKKLLQNVTDGVLFVASKFVLNITLLARATVVKWNRATERVTTEASIGEMA